MNGLSLLFVAAAMGVNAQTELGANNVATFTIRIESLFIEQLRQGQEISQTVNAKDRLVRRFKILVTPDGSSRKGALPTRGFNDNAARSESLVEYEPVLLDNDEIEMWVQIAPERLETLAQGKAIEGEVAANVPGIDRYRIFVGVGQLPRQQSPAASPDSSAPFLLTDGKAGLTRAAAEVPGAPDTTPRIGAPPLRSGQFQGNSSAASSGGSFGAPNANTRANDMRTAIRNQPDSSSVAPPPLDRFGQPTTGNSGFSNQPLAPNFTGSNRDAFNAANNNNNARYTDPYPQPSYSDRNVIPYAYGGNAGNSQPQNYPPNYVQNGAPQNGLPQTTLAARPETVTPNVPAASNVNWQQPATNAAAVTIPTQPAPAVAAAAVKAEDPVRSSTPLILTTLALFTSLGVNAYLGWLAWSFFWRYREAVNDSVRARSYNAPGRQAA